MKVRIFIIISCFILIKCTNYDSNYSDNNYTSSDTNRIIGVWQADNNLVSSAWNEAYQFFQNGDFIFNTSQYDGLQRIVKIKGKYRVYNDTLFFHVEALVEQKGGNIIRSKYTTLNDSWSIENSQLDEIRIESGIDEVAYIEWPDIHLSDTIFIYIDMRKYYKMNNDPNKY